MVLCGHRWTGCLQHTHWSNLHFLPEALTKNDTCHYTVTHGYVMHVRVYIMPYSEYVMCTFQMAIVVVVDDVCVHVHVCVCECVCVCMWV